MDIKEAMEVIRAFYVNGDPIEMLDNGSWRSYYCGGRLGELLTHIASGHQFRVESKEEPTQPKKDQEKDQETDRKISLLLEISIRRTGFCSRSAD